MNIKILMGMPSYFLSTLPESNISCHRCTETPLAVNAELGNVYNIPTGHSRCFVPDRIRILREFRRVRTKE